MSRPLTIVRLAKVMEIVLGDLGLTLNQYRMLTFVQEGLPSLVEVARRLVMKPPNVSVLIDGLVERRLAERYQHPADGRRVEIALTAAGHATLARAEETCDRALAYLAGEAGDEAALLRALDRWQPVLDGPALETLRAELGEIDRRRKE